MAECVVSISNKTWEQLEREITCAVCQEHYTEPKILPCLHYYCKQCILRMDLRTGSGQPFSCPECRSEISLPVGGVDELQTAFFVNRWHTTISNKDRPRPVERSISLEAKCELCTDAEGMAGSFCRQCAMFICEKCVKEHKRMRTYMSHEVVSIEELKQRKGISSVDPAKCQDHREPLVLYCFQCSTLLCRDCIVRDHKDHRWEFCAKAAVTTKMEILDKLDLLTSQTSDLQAAKRKIPVKKEELECREHFLALSIKTVFKELRDILDDREKQLLAEVGVAVKNKTDTLSVQNEELSLACAEVQGVVGDIEQCVFYGSDNEVMSKHYNMLKQIEQQLKNSRSERGMDCVKSVEARDLNVEISCAEAMKDLCYSRARVIDQALDLSKYNISLVVGRKPEVGKTSGATLTITRSNGLVVTKKVQVTSYLKSLSNGAVVKGVVDDTEAGMFRIKYTPVVRGQHKLIVAIDGQQTGGCTVPVFVTISPKKLTKPVKVWKNIRTPAGITATSAGDILVLENQRNIVKLEDNGCVMPFVRQNELTELCEIEVDGEDNVYCIQQGSHKVLKCDKYGHKISVEDLGGGGVELQDLAVVGAELVVAQVEKNVICVYDRNMDYIRSIEDPRNGEFAALASDGDGNIYCADYKNSCVQVFSNDGMFKRCIKHDGKGVNRLKEPHGICVFGHHMYVLEGHTRSVSVFTTDGGYLSSFGQGGSEDEQFILPFSICVDGHGFVYITDNSTDRVQCF